MLKRWKTLSSKILFKNPWWTYKRDEFEIPGKVKGEYHFVHTDGASMVIPILDNGKIVLVNQYRYLCDKESIEFPCGGVKQGKTYEETARIELEEETGFTSSELSYVAEFNPYNGVTDEICKVYIAWNLTKIESARDETEEFEILYKTKKEIDELIETNKIWDGMTIAAWGLMKHKL